MDTLKKRLKESLRQLTQLCGAPSAEHEVVAHLSHALGEVADSVQVVEMVLRWYRTPFIFQPFEFVQVEE